MVIDGDRIEAILIIDGVVYQSDIDHQECLMEYYRTTGHKIPYNWDCDSDSWNKEHEEAMHQTFQMKETHEAFGFDLFDACGLDWVLVAHDKETLDMNRGWAREYCKENNAKLAYFLKGYNAEIV